MQKNIKKRFVIIGLSLFGLFISLLICMSLQKNHGIVGAGINRAFLFLLINVHVITIILLLYLIIRQSIKLFLERKKEVPGSVFKRNLLFAFLFFSVIPALFVFFTAGKFIATSIDAWFDTRINIGLHNGIALHQAHIQELRKTMQQHGQMFLLFFQENMPYENSVDLEKKVKNFLQSKKHLFVQYTIYVWTRDGGACLGSLGDEIRLWRHYRRFNDRTTRSLKEEFFKLIYQPSNNVFDFYGSLYWVQIIDNYVVLLVYRYSEPLRESLIALQNSITDYEQLRSIRNPLYWNYIFTFILIVLLILFLAIWCAFYMARGLGKPIQDLLVATDLIRKGHWDVQLPYKSSDDLQSLVGGFNDMVVALRKARALLEEKNKELFTILENIKAAVFLVNKHGRIIMHNAAAINFARQFSHNDGLISKQASLFNAQIRNRCFLLLREMFSFGKKQESKELSLMVGNEEKFLVVHITLIDIGGTSLTADKGVLFVVEDITDLVKINKIKTWQEAAKQMAHEIKNPLTPIQLATQRLQRRFGKTFQDEPIFADCTNIILQQVQIIKTLVGHFSEFASMPALQLERTDFPLIVEEIINLYKISYPTLLIDCVIQQEVPPLLLDMKKIKRVFINLFDNSIRVLGHQTVTTGEKGKITIKVQVLPDKSAVDILFSDNGPGISRKMRDKVFMPYISTEKKNTGLGLAIVHDIITQHQGTIALVPSTKGATFRIILPILK